MGAVRMFDPYDLRPTIEITAFVLTGVSTLVVALRFCCRIWFVGKLKLYDYVMCAALLCTWGLCVCNHYQLSFGSGAQGPPKRIPNMTAEKMKVLHTYMLYGAAVSWYAYHIGYLAIMGLIKLSILAFYLSFATHRTFRILVHINIALVAVVSVAMILLNAFQCPKKPSYAFSTGILKDRGAGHCFDLRSIFYGQAAASMASDLVILVLPIPLLISLRMNRIKRISLVAVFSIGFLVPIASGVRLWALYLWANSRSSARYYGGYVIFWSQVEANTAIICASAPSFQPLFRRIFGNLSRFQRSRGPYYYYGGRNSMAGPPVAEMIRSSPRDSLSILDTPARILYPPKVYVQEDIHTQVIIVQRSPEEEEIINRVRAFSSKSSLYSQPTSLLPAFSQLTSPMRPSNMLTTG